MTKLKEFIAMMGRRRFTILALLTIVVVATSFTWQQILMPDNLTLNAEKNAAENDRLRLVRDIRDLPGKYAQLIANEGRYDTLSQKGFFLDQDRIDARTRLDNLRAEAGLRGITYDIKPQEKVEHPQSYALNKELVKSQVSVDFKGLTDLEMRDFINRMRNEFGGLVILANVNFERKDPVNLMTLSKLRRQELVDFVGGSAEFYWYSIINKPVAEPTPQAQAFGG